MLWHRGCQDMDELRKNGRAETIRATGAVLIDSVLLYFARILYSELLKDHYLQSAKNRCDGFLSDQRKSRGLPTAAQAPIN